MSDRALGLIRGVRSCLPLSRLGGALLEKPLQELTGFRTREAALAYLVNGIG